MSGQPKIEDALRKTIMSQPDVILDDQDVMQALVVANEKSMGGNIIDLRGIAMERLEARLAETMNKAAEGELSDEDKERLYRLLGAYRGLSEAGLEYARTAEGVDWRPWRESRF